MIRKNVALLLVVFMLLSMFPMGAMAADTDKTINLEAREKKVVFVVD